MRIDLLQRLICKAATVIGASRFLAPSCLSACCRACDEQPSRHSCRSHTFRIAHSMGSIGASSTWSAVEYYQGRYEKASWFHHPSLPFPMLCQQRMRLYSSPRHHPTSGIWQPSIVYMIRLQEKRDSHGIRIVKRGFREAMHLRMIDNRFGFVRQACLQMNPFQFGRQKFQKWGWSHPQQSVIPMHPLVPILLLPPC